MRAREEIARALRCSASCGDPLDCTGCPYLLEASVEGEPWLSCDVDQIALDAAEVLETDARTISALIDDREYYVRKCEELKSQVPRHNYAPPEGGAEDDEA